MKSVMISIKPKWCKLIASGKKTVEVRKTRPKIETPFKCYIYCTKDKHDMMFTEECCGDYYIPYVGNGNVIGEFMCDGIASLTGSNEHQVKFNRHHNTCLTDEEIKNYANGKLYYWHISELVIYDKPKELNEFEVECKGGCDIPFLYDPPCVNCGKNKITHPPQSWCYVERSESE